MLNYVMFETKAVFAYICENSYNRFRLITDYFMFRFSKITIYMQQKKYFFSFMCHKNSKFSEFHFCSLTIRRVSTPWRDRRP